MPEEDREALAQYWTRLQKVRADIDKALLADSDIALTWAAVSDGD